MELILIIIIFLTLSLAFYFLKLPLILAYILAGAFSYKFFQFHNEIVEIINNLAISIVLFFIGFEFSYSKIKNYIKYGILNFTIALFVITSFGFTFSYYISKNIIDSLIFSFLIFPSSSIIIIRILQKTNRLANLEVPLIIIFLVFEDIIIPLFIGILISKSFFSIFYIPIMIISIFVNLKFRTKIKKLLGFFINLDRELFIILLFSIIFFTNFLLNSPIGSFFLGIIVSETYEDYFENELSILREIILIIFFFVFGNYLSSFFKFFEIKSIIIGFVLFIIITIFKSIYFFHFNDFKTFIRSSLTIIPKGEFSIYLAYFFSNYELKTISLSFIVISIILGSIISFYSKNIK